MRESSTTPKTSECPNRTWPKLPIPHQVKITSSNARMAAARHLYMAVLRYKRNDSGRKFSLHRRQASGVGRRVHHAHPDWRMRLARECRPAHQSGERTARLERGKAGLLRNVERAR